MPFTVITLKNVPVALRGDLTKWMQEIATGVYVGNFNAKVREYLWDRVCDAVATGEATLCFSVRNEIGYQFQTINAQREVVNFDGIPLVRIPSSEQESKGQELKNGFSIASHILKSQRKVLPKKNKKSYVVIDIETTGLNINNDEIIEIGAVKYKDGITEEFQELITCDKEIPSVITELTGITNSQLNQKGKDLNIVLGKFVSFIGSEPIVGYNVGFDLKFINEILKKCSMPIIYNETYDLLREVKKEKIFQKNYKLETTLKEYGIDKKVLHRALEDARLTFELSQKVNNFLK